MGNRRYLATSDDDEEPPPPAPPPPPRRSRDEMRSTSQRKRKRMKIYEDDEYEEEERELQEAIKQSIKIQNKQQDNSKNKNRNNRNRQTTSDDDEEEKQHEEQQQEEAKPVGEVVRVSGKGKSRRNHYNSFEFDGITYQLEDPVLLVPDPDPDLPHVKPYVAIIKDIVETKDGNVMVTGQWFYRPEEAEKKNGGNWQSSDTRELFYSFHRDEIHAESVMHKCVVHFIPANKQIPSRKAHPGFIVQKVYDTIFKRLFKLTDKDYEDNIQHEIDLLVQKTMSR